MNILGVDPSLTGTGLCTITGATVSVSTLKNTLRGHERLAHILARAASELPYDMVVIEGPAYGSQGGQAGHHERAGLWWLLTHELWTRKQPYAVITPNGRAKYATGKGTGGKDAVMAATIKRYGHLVDLFDNNQCDALILASMAMHHYGTPLAPVPQVNASALGSVEWPKVA